MLQFLQSKAGRVILSIIWGLALSVFFKKSCTGEKCITIKGPPIEQVKASTYTFDGVQDCYRFSPYLVSCASVKMENHNDGDIGFVDRDGSQVDFEDLTWSATLHSFFRDQPGVMVAHAIASYDSCLETIIPSIITSADSNPIRIQCEYSANPNALKENEFIGDGDEIERMAYRHNTEYELEFKRTQIGRPIIQENTGVRRLLVPNEARIRNITYAANLYCDITHRIRYRNENGEWGEWDSEDKNRVLICKLPLMLGSKYCQLSDQTTETRAELGECKYDNFGYFIINGQEKVLISIERVCDNRVLVFDTATDAKFSDQCELRSAMDARYQIAYTTKVRLYRTTPNNAGKTLRVLFHTLNTDIPIFVLFRALGVDSDRRIIQMIVNDMNDQDMIEMLKPSLEEGLQVNNQTKALDWISRNLKVTNVSTGTSEQEKTDYRLKMVRNCILRYLLPHVGDELETKAHMLGYMTNCLLQSVLGRRNYDDRDHFGNKKIDTPGSLVAFLFAQNFQKKLVKTFEKDMRTTLQGYHDSVANLKIDNKLKPTVIDTGIKYSFATGVWGLKSSMASNRIGVAQQLSRINNKSALSFMRRVISQIDKTGKSVVAPRKLHMSQWGIICPSETPDGESIGIHKHLAMTAVVTDQVDTGPIREILEDEGVVGLASMDMENMSIATKVFLNGDWVGFHLDPPKLVASLKNMRRNGLIHIHTAIVWRIAFSEITIHCDSGRIVRPLYIVEDNTLLITGQQMIKLAKGDLHWQNLLGIGTNSSDIESAVIEYIDVNEAETAMIAMSPKDLQVNSEKNAVYLEYTHCEIHPAVIFGAVISEVPFAGHNQSPRVIYYGQMGKQGIGVYTTSFRQRMDTVAHVLHYPQKPLVTTKTADLMGRDLPTGQNAIVAIMCYSGYNQEDSVIVNEGALARGLFTTTAFKTTKEEERKNQTELQEERFMKPTENTIQNRQNINFDAVGDDGLPIIGKHVRQNDVLIGKAIEMKAAGDGVKTYRDVSHRVEVGGAGIVDDVKCNINGDGFKFVKVKIRSTRVPDIGDKVQSRHAQKGIIGMIFPQEDMPFNEDGLVPDIIINPHAMPKRMTIGQFIETVMGKVCCMKGFEGDATPFNGTRVDDICRLLGMPIEEGGCGFTEHKSENGEYEGYGNETMYNGMTGQKLTCKIFMGPTYYMRSKHMVADKYHARSTGPTQILTRQPPEGRARHGSSRLGEMERDVLIAHGMSNFLKEKFYDASDQYTVNVNRKTGMLAIGNPDNGTLRDDQKDIKKVRMPYCMKLLIQELQSCGIGARLVLG